MPQAIETFTVHLTEAPRGILGDLSQGRYIDIIGQVQTRLDYISGLLNVLKQCGEIEPPLQSTFGAIETLVDDTLAMLTVVPSRGLA